MFRNKHPRNIPKIFLRDMRFTLAFSGPWTRFLRIKPEMIFSMKWNTQEYHWIKEIIPIVSSTAD